MWLVGLLAAAWFVGQWVVGSSTGELVWGGLVLIVAASGFIALLDWRWGVYLFLAWLLFEDLARKYMENDMVIYFGKDVLVGICYFSFLLSFSRGRTKSFRPPFLVSLAAFFFLGLAQAFNPNSSSLLYGLLGLKVYFYYVPLLFLGYALCRSERELVRFLAANLALAALIALLGIIQGIVGFSFLSPQELAPELLMQAQYMRYSPISKLRVVAPASVFVSAGRFGLFVVMMWVLALGAVGYLFLRRHRARYLGLVAGSLLFITAMLSGLRTAFLYTVGSFVVLALGFAWGSAVQVRGVRSRRLVGIVRRTFAFVGVAFVVVLLLYPEAIAARWAFYSETLSPESRQSDLGIRAWNYPVTSLLYALEYPRWPPGYGIGTASLGTQYISKYFGESSPVGSGVEGGVGTLLLELGILGPLLWLFWTIALVRSGWRVVRGLRGTALFPVGFSILWFIFLVLFPLTWTSLAAYQNFSTNAYLWLTAGILFRLPALQAQEAVTLASSR